MSELVSWARPQAFAWESDVLLINMTKSCTFRERDISNKFDNKCYEKHWKEMKFSFFYSIHLCQSRNLKELTSSLCQNLFPCWKQQAQKCQALIMRMGRASEAESMLKWILCFLTLAYLEKPNKTDVLVRTWTGKFMNCKSELNSIPTLI